MKSLVGWMLVMSLGAVGCREAPRQETSPRPLVVRRATTPIRVDGCLNEPSWQNAPSVPLALPKPEQGRGRILEDEGSARLLYDDENLYVGFDLRDADLVAEESKGEVHLFRLGDVAEVFLKPADQLGYWEFHVNPRGKTLTYGYPGRGRLGLPSTIGLPSFITAAAAVQGTLNDCGDMDRGWAVEMAIPLRNLERRAPLVGPKEAGTKPKWMILLARYNYSAYRRQAGGPELSSVPVVSEVNFHRSEDYAPLEWVP